MKVFFSTDWTLNGSVLTEDENNIITLHDKPMTWGQSKGNVCLIAENELGEIIATSGCGEEEPLITERFIRFWAESGFPAEMDIEISELYLEDLIIDSEDEETFEEWLASMGLESSLPKSDLEELEEQWHSMNHLYEIVCEESEDEEDEPNAPTYRQYESCERQLYRMVDKLKNKLPSPPSEIQTFTDMYGNVYDSLEACEEGEKQITFQSMTIAEKKIEDDMYLANLEKEARKSMKKHKLVKRKDLPKRVDFEMLVNSSSLIWNAGHLLGISEDPNNPTVSEGQEAVKNFLLFLQLMKNPKFATRASFEIEKLLNK